MFIEKANIVELKKKYKIIHLKEISSTNFHAYDLLSDKLINSPTLIIADYQFQGKGQTGNTWESNAGMNVLLSLIQFPKSIKAVEQFYISKITAIAVKETIKVLIKETVIKWPNDILAGKEKISGILIENILEGDRINSSVAGVGINVNQVSFNQYPLKAASIKMITGKDVPLSGIIDSFIERFDNWFEIMEYRDFVHIDKEYLMNLYGFEKVLSFRKEGVIFEGRIIDVEKDGRLVLLLSNNRKQKFVNKEIEFLI